MSDDFLGDELFRMGTERTMDHFTPSELIRRGWVDSI